MRRVVIALAIVLLLAVPARGDGVLIEGFQWDTQPPPGVSWWDHLSDRCAELREMGVTAIWAPPATKGASGGYSDGYDIYDYYDLGSKDQMGTIPTRYGTKEQFLAFVAIAHANGLDVYSDVVLNQRAGGAQGGYDYSMLKGAEATGRGTMGPWDFHHNGQGDLDMDLIGMRDIAQENPATRDTLFSWIKWFDKQSGCDGYRIDAAKHMPAWFVEGLLYQVQEGLGPNRSRFAVGEYFDRNVDTLEWWVSAVNRRSSVFDYELFFQMKAMVDGGGYYDMRGLRSRFQDEGRSVTFVNNHDTFGRGNGFQIWNHADVCYALVLSSTGYPCVYWKDLYDDQGNARDYLKNLVWIANRFAHGRAIERWADQDLYVFEREGSLLTGLNDDGASWRTQWVQTSFGSNVRLHDYTGHQPDRWTNQDGWVQISVPPWGYVCYARDGSQGQTPSPAARRTTQEHEGNADMDRPRLAEAWNDVVKIPCEKGQPIQVELWLQDPSLTAHVCLLDKDGKRLNHVRGTGGVIRLEYLNPPSAGWYQVRAGLEITGQNKRAPYWLKLSYQAPRSRPAAYPAPGSENANVLPLVSTSTGP